MVRPELFAVVRERARGERNRREILDLRRFLANIEPRNSPLLGFVRNVFVLLAANHVERSIDKSVAANFRADVDRAKNSSGIVHLINQSLIPLAEIIMLTIESSRMIR